MMRNDFFRDLRRTLDRFGNLPFPALPGQVKRAMRLHLSGWTPLPAPRPARAERIVVSLSTTPSRAKLIGPALRSLADQEVPADRIVLALPHRSRRNGVAYPAPETLPLPPGVDVLRCKDQGPATKFLPVLRAERNALLVVVDDDVVYPRSFLRELLAAHRRRPDAALGLRGVRREEGRRFADLRHVFGTGIGDDAPVDILFGTWGFLLPPIVAEILPLEIAAWGEAVRWVDDIWLSAQLARAGVERFVVPASGLPIETLAAFRGSLSGGINRTGRNEEAALAALADCWDGPPLRRQEAAE